MAVHCGNSCTVGSWGVQRFYLLGAVWVSINTFYWCIFRFYLCCSCNHKQGQVHTAVSSWAMCFPLATVTTRWRCWAGNGLKTICRRSRLWKQKKRYCRDLGRCFFLKFHLFILFLWMKACILVFCSKGTPARWRDFHSATIIGTKMYVFGGRADRFGPFHSNNELYCNMIRVFETVTNTWLNTPITQPLIDGRRSHSACKRQTIL